MSSNEHVRGCLREYISFAHSPGFAVLVCGPWGAGKTHLVKRLLEEDFVEGEKQNIYVSLYGLTSLEDVHKALVEAVVPELSSKVTKIAAKVGSGLLRMANFDPQISFSDLFDKFDARVFVFDDIERCGMPLNSVLGYINSFVEHNGSKVILIAHDKKIVEQQEYLEWREKLIGRTVQVTADFAAAFPTFLDEIGDAGTKALLKSAQKDVDAIFQQSGTNNLRILKQAFWDFERLVAAVESDCRENTAGMIDLLRVFLALALEFKAGTISDEDIVNRENLVFAGVLRAEEAPKNKLLQASARYPDVRLDDAIISNASLVDILTRGLVDSAEINATLRASPQFAAQGQEPIWRLLCYATERDDDVVEAALLQFEKMFAQREFVIIGEIQHVFGLRLWHAQNGLLDRTKDEVLQEGMAYIDDLYANKKLLPIPLNDYKSDVRFQGYGGLGIFCLETEEYRKLFDYMQARRKQALEDRYPEMASSLLEEMVSDPNLFVRRVCSNDSDDSIYARVPIMAAANAKTFVDTLLKQPPAHQEVILSAFTERYKFDRLNSELAPEKQWFAAVYAEMKRRLKKMTPVAQHRLRMYFRWHFEPVFVAEAD